MGFPKSSLAESERSRGRDVRLLVVVDEEFIRPLEAKDFHPRGHSLRVTLYSVAIGKKMGLPPDRLGNLRRAAILHDPGKIGVREAILNKPGRPTGEEIREVGRHPEVATQILPPSRSSGNCSP